VYWSGAALFVTGALWLVYRFFLREHGEFGEPPHPMEEWWLRLHGTFAVLMLIIAGSLLPVHVRVGWHQRKNLLAGCIVVAVVVLLIVSGYVLYYSDEETRPVVSTLHWIIGLGAPVALIWHIVSGRATRSTSDQYLATAGKPETGQPQQPANLADPEIPD
jgi:hypothetical protein